MIVRELLTAFGFDIDTSGLKKFTSSIESAKGSLTAIGLSIAGAAGSIFGLMKNVSNVGDEISKSSEELGLSTNALQEWRYASEQAGISNEELAQNLRIFSRNIGDAATSGTGPFVDRMNDLGISLTDNNDKLKDTDTLLLELSEALVGVQDQAVKGAIAQELFGRGGLRMATWMSGGADAILQLREEAYKLNLIMGQQAIDTTKNFNDNLNKVFGVVKAVKNEIGVALMPVLEQFLNKFLEWIQLNRDFVAQRIGEVLETLYKLLRYVWIGIDKLGSAFEWFIKVTGSVEKAMYTLLGAFALWKFGPIISGVLSLTASMIKFGRSVITAQNGLFFIPIAAVAIITLIGMAIREILEFFGVIDKETADSITNWDLLKTAIGAVLGAFALEQAIAIVKWLAGLSRAAWAASTAMFGLNASMLLIPAAIIAIGYLLYKLYEAFEGLTMGEIADKIKAAFSDLPEFFKGLFTSIADWVSGIFDGIVNGIKNKYETLKRGLKTGLFGFSDEEASVKLTQILDKQSPANIALASVANEANKMSAAPSVATDQLLRFNPNNIGASNTVTNNRPVNVNSNINITVPTSLTGDSQDIAEKIRVAVGDEMDRLLETGLHNNVEQE